MENEQLLSKITDLIGIAKKLGADAADGVLYRSADLTVSCRLGKPETMERAESSAAGLRVFVGESQAIASTSDFSTQSLTELAERVVSMAKIATPDPYSRLAPEELLARDIPALELYDGVEPNIALLQEECRITEEAALSVDGITNSEGAEAHYGSTYFALATSHGFAQDYRTSSASLSVSVLAGTGTGMERDYEFSSARWRDDLLPCETVGLKAAERTLLRLNPQKIETTSLPVVFDPRVGRSLVSTLAGALSGSAIARGTSFLKDKMGQAILPSGIHLIDDPHRMRGLGSRPFDAEGVKNGKRTLIKDGELHGWLLDVRSASKLGLTTSGNASRGVASPPAPSTTNLYLTGGHIKRHELIGSIKRGVYITETFGMGVNIVTGDYSQGAAGYMIEDGEITHAISEFTIAGHLADMWRNILVADDLEFKYATNAPTLAVASMTIAGQ